MLPLSNHLFSHWSIPLKTKKCRQERNEDESSEGVIMKEKVIREEEVERELTNQSWNFVKGRFNKLMIIFLSGFSKFGEISSTFLSRIPLSRTVLVEIHPEVELEWAMKFVNLSWCIPGGTNLKPLKRKVGTKPFWVLIWARIIRFYKKSPVQLWSLHRALFIAPLFCLFSN